MKSEAPTILRPATAADAPTLCELFRDTVRTVNVRDYSAQQVAVWSGRADRLDWMTEKIATQRFVVALREDAIVGFASIAPKTGRFDMIYVAAAHQRTGIGCLLGEAVLDAARTAAVSKAKAEVSITARPFFEALGFSYVADAFPEIDGVSLPNVFMSMELNPSVRVMTLKDLATIERLDARIFGGEGYGPYTWRQILDLHAPFVSVGEAYAPDAPRTIAGFAVGAIGHDGVGWFLTLGVADTARGQGLGRALIRRTVQKLTAHGATAIRLTVAPDNTPARSLYSSLGFEEHAIEADYYGPGRDRLVMMREP